MIKGWIRTTLLDYPGHIASVIFFGGCCFRCPMCHNPDLVLNPESLPDISTQSVLDYLYQHNGKITGLVISGGEPCLSNQLPDFLSQVRKLGVKIKLDTCGYFPDMLQSLLDNHLLDMVAMDVKAPPEKYNLLTGTSNIDFDRILASIDILRRNIIPCEFRTTVVSDWITLEDITLIARWLEGADLYVLQQFRPQNCLDPALNHKTPYSYHTLHVMQSLASQYIRTVLLRGV